MVSPLDWNVTPASNTSIGGVAAADHMETIKIDDLSRAIAAGVKAMALDLGGATTTTGSSGAYAFASNGHATSLVNGAELTFRANHSNAGAATLNVNALGVKAIRKFTVGGEVDVAAGDIVSGGHYRVQYNSGANGAAGAWILLDPTTGGNFQPLDADLTALGGLAKTDGNFIVGDGSTWVVESGATARASLGAAALASAQTFTAQQTISLATSAAIPLVVRSTNADANAGPFLNLYRNSASPANGDEGPALNFVMNDSGGAATDAANIRAVWDDTTDGSEDAHLDLRTIAAGTLASRVQVGAGLVVGAASGGYPGNGEINAIGYRINGTAQQDVASGANVTFGTVTLGTDLSIANGGTGASDAAGARSNLGLGTAATQNTGASGATVPLLNGSNTWSGSQEVGDFTSPATSDGLLISPTTGCFSSRNASGVATHISFSNTNGQVGSIQTTGSTTNYNTSSDERLKTNFTPLLGSMALINRIAVYDFLWRANGERGFGPRAQELHQVAPFAVTAGGDDPQREPWSWDAGKLVPHLIVAIQELSAELGRIRASVGLA